MFGLEHLVSRKKVFLPLYVTVRLRLMRLAACQWTVRRTGLRLRFLHSSRSITSYNPCTVLTFVSASAPIMPSTPSPYNVFLEARGLLVAALVKMACNPFTTGESYSITFGFPILNSSNARDCYTSRIWRLASIDHVGERVITEISAA